jgi:hypothetical protein
MAFVFSVRTASKSAARRFKSFVCVRMNVNRDFPPPKKQALHKRQNTAQESALPLRDSNGADRNIKRLACPDCHNQLIIRRVI